MAAFLRNPPTRPSNGLGPWAFGPPPVAALVRIPLQVAELRCRAPGLRTPTDGGVPEPWVVGPTPVAAFLGNPPKMAELGSKAPGLLTPSHGGVPRPRAFGHPPMAAFARILPRGAEASPIGPFEAGRNDDD